MVIKIEIDDETHSALMREAVRHRRPTDWHALVLVRQGLGLPFPYPSESLAVEEKEPAGVAER
jgi:hypothetical protein